MKPSTHLCILAGSCTSRSDSAGLSDFFKIFHVHTLLGVPEAHEMTALAWDMKRENTIREKTLRIKNTVGRCRVEPFVTSLQYRLPNMVLIS